MKDKLLNYVNIEQRVIQMYSKLLNRSITLDDIKEKWINDIQTYATIIVNGEYDPTDDGLKALIMITLDQYTYSEDGSVFISDHDYDMIHRLWQVHGHKPLIYADIFGSEWKMVHHNAPWMVGTVQKVYTLKELETFINNINYQYGSTTKHPIVEWVVAPKFDGISANLEIKDHKLIQAITRGDREMGQDITEVVLRCCNLDQILYWRGHETGFLKVELCVPTREFPPLKEQGYANRRSATSAIVNSPKNIQNACHIEAVPLLWYGEDGIDYNPQDSVRIKSSSAQELISIAQDVLRKVKSPDYEFRADGVVLYPMITDMNTNDVMENSMAFKVNTAKAYTHIIRGYVSMGRTGYAVPMIEVEPCDVNETVVTDVSLGSFGKFYQMGLHEGEEVIIYSAGDVIPQMKQCDPPKYKIGSPYLQIPEICPYCGQPLENAHCTNSQCVRIKTGRITNFLQKLGVEDVSDSTIELLYDKKIIRELPDVLALRMDDFDDIEGIGPTKASNILNEIKKLRERPISISEFFGAIGCPGVSEKISQLIFQEIPFDQLINESRMITPKNLFEKHEMRDRLFMISGIGESRATTIINFVAEHRVEIQTLARMMNLVGEVQYKATIVFSGFRDKNWVEKFKKIGIRVAETMNRNTVLVVASNLNTSKAKRAIEMGIPLILYSDIEDGYDYCSKL